MESTPRPMRATGHARSAAGRNGFPRGLLSFGPRPRARARLFCLPHAGGSAEVFRRWWRLVPDELDVLGVEYPGRGARAAETPLAGIGAMVDDAERLVSGYLDRPYALFGHSMGSLVAFELCHRLLDSGKPPPAVLIVSGRASARAARDAGPVSALPDEELAALLHRISGTAPDIAEDPELARLVLASLRADFGACETYQPSSEARLPVPMAAYGGLADPGVSRDELRAWANETSLDCGIRMFPGDHFFIRSAAELVAGAAARDVLARIGR
jgi:medium-chain acyl-[acyl-carrier-protein] hydrolase